MLVTDRGRRWVVAVLGVLAACMLGAPAAQAALGFQGLSGKPADLPAGANSTVNIHIGFTDPSDQVKDLTVHLPPGLVGNPTVAPLCTSGELDADGCPAASQVGSVTAHVNAQLLSGISLPLTVDGSLYNLKPHAGEPARFGIVLRPVGGLLPKIVQESAVKLRRSDFGLDTIVNDFPRKASGLETDITSLDLSLNGKVNGKGFMRNPTSCSAKAFTFDAVSYSGHQVHGAAPSFTPTNCGSLPFSPKFTARLGTRGATKAGTNPPLTTVIAQDPGESGLASAKVLLPPGVEANSALLTIGCPIFRFEVDASTCPPKTIVGSASASSPFVPSALTGPVVLVTPGKNDFLPRLGVELNGPLSLHILGSFVLESTGSGNAFAKLPDIPIARFALSFHGGKNGLVSLSRSICGPHPPRFLGVFDGFNGAHRQGRVPARVSGCR